MIAHLGHHLPGCPCLLPGLRVLLGYGWRPAAVPRARPIGFKIISYRYGWAIMRGGLALQWAIMRNHPGSEVGDYA